MLNFKSSPSSQKIQSRQQWLIENVLSLGLAALVVLLIRSSIIQAFKIPSGSMIPTLFIGDYIFVNKFAYGLKIPFSDVLSSGPIYLIKREPPQRGDVIVFLYPQDESVYYIKRVIGVPGDTIEIRDKIIYVNQERVAHQTVPDLESKAILNRLNDAHYPPDRMKLYLETVGNAEHWMMLDPVKWRSSHYDFLKIPPDYYFVMGDNRDYSGDSRHWGLVPRKNIQGQALVIWLSLWIDFSEKEFRFRPDRIGTVIR